jgi:mRNA-processing protein COX24
MSGSRANLAQTPAPGSVSPLMGSLIKKRRKRMRKKKHKKMLKRTRWQRRAGK